MSPTGAGLLVSRQKPPRVCYGHGALKQTVHTANWQVHMCTHCKIMKDQSGGCCRAYSLMSTTGMVTGMVPRTSRHLMQKPRPSCVHCATMHCPVEHGGNKQGPGLPVLHARQEWKGRRACLHQKESRCYACRVLVSVLSFPITQVCQPLHHRVIDLLACCSDLWPPMVA